MTLQQQRDSETRPTRVPAGRTGPGSALWLVWRQHGGLLVASSVIVLALCVALALAQSTLVLVHCTNTAYDMQQPLPPTACGSVYSDHTTLYSWSRWLLRTVVFLPVVVGTLWGAPLVSRELERGTQGLAWGQSLSAGQWLTRKVAVLGLIIAFLGLPLWWFAHSVALSLSRVGVINRFAWEGFATTSPLVVPYSLAALAVGVLSSVLLRKTLPAVVVAAAACAALGIGTADHLRPHYEPPVSVHYPASLNGIDLGPNVLEVFDNGWADSAGRPTNRYPAQCNPDDAGCLAAHGISGRVSVYQPAGREATFQWIEGGLTVLLGAGCLVLAGRLVRRR
jgi:hypothetical protein